MFFKRGEVVRPFFVKVIIKSLCFKTVWNKNK